MSVLLDLLKPGWHRKSATATPATHIMPEAPSVALVATVAGANPTTIRTCDGCQHSGVFFTRAAEYGENHLHVTCRAPVEAELTRVFEIVYPTPDFAKRCAAFTPKTMQ
jgi:hypothetical protein